MLKDVPWSHELDWPAGLKPFHPFDTEIQSAPYEHYAWMRQNAPLLRAGNPESPLYIVSRFDDVTRGLRDHTAFSSVPNTSVKMEGFLLSLDPPDHTRLRQAANRAFTPRAIAILEPVLTELVAARWQTILQSGGGEVMGGFASPLTISVISTVLGIPVEHSGMMREWTSAFIDYLGLLFRGAPDTGQNDAAPKKMIAYINDILDAAAGSSEDSVVVNLARLREEGALTRQEACGFAILLFIAGHETSTLLTGNCLDFLSVNPHWLDYLRAPDGPSAFLTEMLRFRPPVHRLTRYTYNETELGGFRIPAGASVRFMVASANRDEAKYSEPDTFNPDRKNVGHAAFGYGIHMCMGSWLARMELAIVLKTISETTRSISPNHDYPRIPLTGGAFATVGLQSMGLTVQPRART